jgi:tetratricopeptide (TPR) repeat protein
MPRLLAFLTLASLAALADPPRLIPATTSSQEALAQYQKGLDLLDNVRIAAASAALEKALSIDPAFASARATLASLTPAPRNEELIQKALSESAALPEAERAQIELIAANIHGDDARQRELRRKVADLCPDDWRAFQALGVEALGDRTWERAVENLNRATSMNPQAAGAWNLLGYAYMMQTKYEQAIATLRKYAEVAPQEPNAHDSLGEALLNANRLEEAEAEFRKAVAMDPHFVGAWTAIAQTRILRGDWTGGLAALRNEKRADQRPVDKAAADLALASALYAQGKFADAGSAFAAVQKSAEKAGLPQRFFALGTRALYLSMDGKAAEALELAKQELAAIAGSKLSATAKKNFSIGPLATRLRAEAQLRKEADAGKTFAELEASIQPLLKQAFQASLHAEARGLRKLASGDAKGAVEEMQACLAVDTICQIYRFHAQEQAGDAQGAQATREQILKTPIRGLAYVYAWSRLTKPKMAQN